MTDNPDNVSNFVNMTVDTLYKVHHQLEHYRQVLADIDEALRDENPKEVLTKRRRLYEKYIWHYEKKYKELKSKL